MKPTIKNKQHVLRLDRLKMSYSSLGTPLHTEYGGQMALYIAEATDNRGTIDLAKANLITGKYGYGTKSLLHGDESEFVSRLVLTIEEVCFSDTLTQTEKGPYEGHLLTAEQWLKEGKPLHYDLNVTRTFIPRLKK